MGSVIQSVSPNHFSKEFLKYIFMKFYMFLSVYITNYPIGLAFWAIPIGL